MKVDELLATSGAYRAARWATADRLRVLAYHDVPDAAAFVRQLELIMRDFNPVSETQVIAWTQGASLPPHPLWITFDDGDLSVFRDALPILADAGVPATAFVCPALIGTSEPHWWQVLDRAIDAGLVFPSDVSGEGRADVVRQVKELSDPARRQLIQALRGRTENAGVSAAREQPTASHLAAWLSAGNTLGNHTWDHPCLDRCEPHEQIRQVHAAHEGLRDLTGHAPSVFAWPNGYPAEGARRHLRELDYRLVLTFDHRLARRTCDPMAMPRLRLDSSADLARTRAVLSGSHSGLFHLTAAARPSLNRRRHRGTA